ncbi:hypothetical protein AD998_13030 [bacterium 336/3]|nr:hypothetical protein AD998_13030 [bacterium 336/3]
MESINEYFFAEAVTPLQLDYLLAHAWRHFGTYFFRYDNGLIPETEEFSQIIPLRINLERFEFSKSQRKILKKNEVFRTVFQEATITSTKKKLFNLHKQRFVHNTPENIYSFLSKNPAKYPTNTYEVAVYNKRKLIAVSFVDVAEFSFSSVYAMFDTTYYSYSLGIYTLLKEIEFAKTLGKKYLYLGYAFKASSFYDYKKNFSALEQFDWLKQQWSVFEK